MALTDTEITRARYHLGWPSVTMGAGLGLGQPTYVQALFPVDGAMRQLQPGIESTVRGLIAQCDRAEAAIAKAEDRLSASSVGEITLNDREMQQRRTAYRYWVRRLSEASGAEVNPSSSSASGGECMGARILG